MQNTENNCFRPWMEYLIGGTNLPDTPNWDGTIWKELLNIAQSNEFNFIVTLDGNIYEVISEDRVRNVSRVMSWGEVTKFGFNSKTRPIFRTAWINNNMDQYIQYFSPVGHGMERFSMLDGFGPDEKTTLPLLPFPMLKNKDDEFVPYIPSMEDLMAKDWIIAGWDNLEENNQIKEIMEIPEPAESEKSKINNNTVIKLTWWPCVSDKKIVSDNFMDFNDEINWFELLFKEDGLYNLIQKTHNANKPVYEINIKAPDLEAGIKFTENETFENYMPLNVRLDMDHELMSFMINRIGDSFKPREIDIDGEDSMLEVVRKLLNVDDSFDIKVIKLGEDITDLTIMDLGKKKKKKKGK